MSNKQVMKVKPIFHREIIKPIGCGFTIRLVLNENQRWHAYMISGLNVWVVSNRHGVELKVSQNEFELLFEECE